MIDVLVGYIPLVMVSICVVSLAVYYFKYRRELEKTDSWLSYYSWGIATLLMCLLVIYLRFRDIDVGGFAAPIVMALILLGFFFYMALLPIMRLQKKEEERR